MSQVGEHQNIFDESYKKIYLMRGNNKATNHKLSL
jgi:hypothetical protein